MGIPSTIEYLLMEQYFWVQRKTLSCLNDPDSLYILYHTLLCIVNYVAGKAELEKLPKLSLSENIPQHERAKHIRNAILQLSVALAGTLRVWADEKRIRAMQAGGF